MLMKSESRPIRVLHCTTKLGTGGVQSFLRSYAAYMDPQQVVFDFAVQTNTPQQYDQEISALGGKIFHVHPMRDSVVKYFFDIYKVCKTNPEIVVIHSHLNFRNFIPLLAARMAGVKVRISHSHSCYESKSIVKAVARKIFQLCLPLFATECWGCSEKANSWLYGSDKADCAIVHNAISVDTYAFDERVRTDIRNTMSLKNNLVLIHVGTFGAAKNHEFLLALFSVLKQRRENAKLLLCGDGPLRENIEKKISELKLGDAVILLGMTNNISELLMAADVFVLPSLYEGLPLSAVEAQASGIPCVVSNSVPSEAIFMRNVCVCSQFDAPLWCSAIEKVFSCSTERCGGAKAAREAGYDTSIEAAKLQNLYLSCVGSKEK